MVFRFYKQEEGRWFIDLPSFINEGGKQSDLEMVAGADDLLNEIAEDLSEVRLQLLTANDQVLHKGNDPKWICLLIRERNMPDTVGLGMEYTIDVTPAQRKFHLAFHNRPYKQTPKGIKTERVWLCDAMRFAFTGDHTAPFPDIIGILHK